MCEDISWFPAQVVYPEEADFQQSLQSWLEPGYHLTTTSWHGHWTPSFLPSGTPPPLMHLHINCSSFAHQNFVSWSSHDVDALCSRAFSTAIPLFMLQVYAPAMFCHVLELCKLLSSSWRLVLSLATRSCHSLGHTTHSNICSPDWWENPFQVSLHTLLQPECTLWSSIHIFIVSLIAKYLFLLKF